MKQIEKVYMVMCGDCIVAYPIYGVTQRKSLDNKLRELGWAKRTIEGERLWVCGDCAERGNGNGTE